MTMVYYKQHMRSLFTLVLILFVVFSPWIVVAQSSDTSAPKITSVKVASSTDTTVTITWETDEKADSAVNYSLNPDLGVVRVPVADRTTHSVTLENLESGRTYYFRVISADADGNQGISADYKIDVESETKSENSGSGTGVGPGQTNTPEQIVEQIQQIQSPQQLQEILNETVKAIQGITEDLTIVGPPTVVPETTFATVSWSTDRPASSEVRFAKTNGFDGSTYTFSQASTDGAATDHNIRLIGLEPYTEYSFQVRSTDEYQITGESKNYTFKTKASLPDIRNLRIVKVEENAATLAWDTTVPAKALIEYQDLTTGAQNSLGRPTLATTHQMRITDLTLGTRYVAFVIAENSGGDRVRSQPIQFITVKDTAPPLISNVTNESTIFPGGESRIQTIIEWNTDEAASCIMTYREGVAGGVDPIVLEKEVVEYNTNHVEVITDFAPATVYQFWLNCTDEAGNTVQSENFVLFTPIILENFESTFGWVKNITN
jgi:hypothetical protein